LDAGSAIIATAETPPITTRNSATRFRRTTMAATPTRSAISTQRAEPGKRRWG
jgi:hypothetical protein